MQLNLSGVRNFNKDISLYTDTTRVDKETINSLPLNVRIFTLPTCAVFRAIDGVFENISKTIIFGMGGVLSFDVTLIAASANCALSTFVEPVTLFVLGVSCPFMKHSQATAFAEAINNFDILENKQKASFNVLTSRIIALAVDVQILLSVLVKEISALAIKIIHYVGEIITDAIGTTIKIVAIGVSWCIFTTMSLIDSADAVKRFFNEKKNIVQ